MGNSTQNNENPSSGFACFMSKFGMVLSRTKDTVIHDFLNDIPSYVKNISSDQLKIDENTTFEDLQKNYFESGKEFTQFVNCIFNKLGYDLSNLSESQELFDLVNAIFNASLKLGNSVQQLTTGFANDPGVKDLMNKIQSAHESDNFDILNTGGTWSTDEEISDDLEDKFAATIDIITELFSLCKKFRKVEWDKIKNEAGDFGGYLKETVAERIFDYVLIVFLKNAREVYAEDIEAIMEVVNEVKGEAQEVLDKLKAYKEEYEKLKEAAKKELKALLEEAGKTVEDIEEELRRELKSGLRRLSLQLQTRLRQLMEELERTGVIDAYMEVARICERIYAVLHFCKVIKEEKIDFAKFVPDFPTLDEVHSKQLVAANDEVNKITAKVQEVGLLSKEEQQQLKIGDLENGINKVVGELNSSIKETEQKLRDTLPTVDIYVIRWNRVADMFTSPIDYFQGIYPLNSYSDAEELMTEILNLARAFNSNVPDFQSLKRMLYDLLVRVENRIVQEFKNMEVPEGLKKFRAFIHDLIAMLENITLNVVGQLRYAFKQLENAAIEAENIWVKLGTRLEEDIKKLSQEYKYKSISICRYSSLADDDIISIFVNPLLRSVKIAYGKYPVFKEDDTKPFEELFSSAKANSNALIASYKEILQEIETYTDNLLNPNIYVSRYNDMLCQLKEEFERQTKDIPVFETADEFNKFVKEKIESLASGNGLSFPAVSKLDFSEYLSIISDGMKSLVPKSPEMFVTKFRSVTEEYFEKLLKDGGELESNVDKSIDDYSERIRNFSEEVFALYWIELARELSRRFFQPYIDFIECVIKEWSLDTLLPAAVESVYGILESTGNGFSFDDYSDFVEKHDDEIEYMGKVCNAVYHNGADEEAKPKSAPAPKTRSLRSNFSSVSMTDQKEIKNRSTVVKEFLQLIISMKDLHDRAQTIDTWSDGLQFMLRLYQVIPNSVKVYLKDVINLPSWNFNSIKLPEYRLDTKNKFLAVNIWKFQNQSSTDTSAVAGGIDIQLLAFIGKKSEDEEDTKYGIYVIPVISGNLDVKQQVGDNHLFELGATVDLNKNDIAADTNIKKDGALVDKFKNGLLGLFISGNNFKELDIDLLCDDSAVKARLDLVFKRGKLVNGKATDAPVFSFFDAKYASLTIANYPQSLYLSYDNKFDVGYQCKLEDLSLVLKLGEINDFMKKILKDDINLTLTELKLGYSLSKGFDIDGGFMARIPFNADLDLKAVRFKGLNLELGGCSGSLKALLGMNFTVNLTAFSISFPNMALGFDCNLIDSCGRLGDFDFSPDFRFPTGLGIAIDIAGIKGAGGIDWNADTGSFKGFLQLDILGLFGASAVLAFDMKKKDGTPGFSMFGAVSVVFTPGIQLGLGFSITRLGGSLGVNRRLDIDKLRDATYDGTLASIVFIDDLVDNIDEVLSNITAYYPSQEDQFFLGFMARIDWAKMFTVDVGIFIQAPKPTSIVIAGSFNMSLSEDVEKLLCIKVDFLGEFDIMKGILLDASIHDSYIVGISFYGDISLRILWGGDTKGFLISAGGFHPEYTPAPGFKVSKMRRLGMKLDYDILQLSLECYFAVTSNSVQFGASAFLLIGWENKFDISGKLTFNVLFQWCPFYFSTDISLQVAVHVFGMKLCAISLSFALSGPAQWRAKGSAYFWFLMLKVGVDFNLKWGKKQGDSNRARIDVKPLFTECFEDKTNANWKALTSDLSDNLVTLAEIASDHGIVVQPSERLSFCQDAIPLNMHLDHYGEEDINDFNQFDLKELMVGSYVISKQAIKTAKTLFAPNQIKKMSNEEKLKSESYIKVDGGFELAGDMFEDVNAAPTTVLLDEYECFARDLDSNALNMWKQIADQNQKNKYTEQKRVLINRRPIKNPVQHKPIEGKKQSNNARPSMRRNAEGFKRYVKKLDNYLMNDIESLVDQL